MSVKRKIVYVVLFTVGFAAPFVFTNVIAGGAVKGAIHKFFFTPSVIKNHHFNSLDSVENPDEHRVRFMFAYQSKQGFYGLKKTNMAIEGGVVVLYAVTDDGVLSLLTDYTMAENSLRKFVKKKVDSVSFEPVDANGSAGKSKSYLRFTFNSGGSEKM